jgi:hypothetical protein
MNDLKAIALLLTSAEELLEIVRREYRAVRTG